MFADFIENWRYLAPSSNRRRPLRSVRSVFLPSERVRSASKSTYKRRRHTFLTGSTSPRYIDAMPALWSTTKIHNTMIVFRLLSPFVHRPPPTLHADREFSSHFAPTDVLYPTHSFHISCSQTFWKTVFSDFPYKSLIHAPNLKHLRRTYQRIKPVNFMNIAQVRRIQDSGVGSEIHKYGPINVKFGTT